MNEQLTIESERIDDIPLLLGHLERMGVAGLLDQQCPAHGNRKGVSLGNLACMWLAHILSEGDHRLLRVREWAQQRLRMLGRCSGQAVRAEDFTDDRLADVLSVLGEDERWQGFESRLNGQLLRVYELQPELVRLDSTTANGYWTVREDGLWQYGHSKDGRPDLPQIKIMLASLDPLGLPLATQVLSGERADDPLYVPAIDRVRQGIAQRGLLYVGDSKMCALSTRSHLQAGGDYYLCPLNQLHLRPAALAALLEPVWRGEQGLVAVGQQPDDGQVQVIAEGFELSRGVVAEVAGEIWQWDERWLVVRSLFSAERACQQLDERLARAQQELAELLVRKRGKKVYREVAALQQRVEAILRRQAVGALLQVSYQQNASGQPVALQVEVDQQAVVAHKRLQGWRVYVTNQPAPALSLAQAVLAYRGEYRIEQNFGRLKGKQLSLSPTYLRRDDRITGLVRLLSIGLRCLTLLEFTVRRRLAQEQATLAGLYSDSAKHVTARPTAARLLAAFKDLTLTVITLPGQTHRHLTPLSDLQLRILALLDLPVDLFARLTTNPANSP